MALDIVIQTVGKNEGLSAINEVSEEEKKRLKQFEEINKEAEKTGKKYRSWIPPIKEAGDAMEQVANETESVASEIKSVGTQSKEAKKHVVDLGKALLRVLEIAKSFKDKVTVNIIGRGTVESAKQAEQAVDSVGDKVEDVNKEADKTPKKYKAWMPPITEVKKGVDGIADETDRVGDEAKEAKKAFVDVGSTLKKIAQIAVFKQLLEGLLGIGKAAFVAAKEMEGLKNILKLSTGGDLQESNKVFNQLEATTDRLGLNFRDTAKSYKLIAASAKAANFSTKEGLDIFEGVATAATSAQLSGEQFEGALLAISQMMSKGKVQAEELRGQLAERIPGAFSIAAKSINVTTAQLNDMLQKGQVIAKDFLPKFAAELKRTYGKGLGDATNSLQAIQNRAENATFRLQANIGKALTPFFKGTISAFGSLADAAADFVSSATPTADIVRAEKDQLNDLVAAIKDSNTQNEERQTLINELNAKYPEFTSKIDVTKASEKDLKKALEETNKQYDRRIFILASEDITKKFEKDITRQRVAIASFTVDLKKAERRRDAATSSVGRGIAEDNIKFFRSAIKNSRKLIKELEGEKRALLKALEKDAKTKKVDTKSAKKEIGKPVSDLSGKQAKALSKQQIKAAKDAAKARFNLEKRLLKATQENEKMMLDAKIKANEEALKSDNLAFNQRKQITEQNAQLQIEKAGLEVKNRKELDSLITSLGTKDVQKQKSIASEVKNLEMKRANEVLDIRKKLAQDLESLDKDYFTELEQRYVSETTSAITRIDKLQDAASGVIEANAARQLTSLNKTFLTELQANQGNKDALIGIEERFQAKKQQIIFESQRKQIKNEIDAINKKLEAENISNAQVFELSRELEQKQLALLKLEVDNYQKTENKKTDIAKKGADERAAIEQAAVNLGNEIISGAFELQRARFAESIALVKEEEAVKLKAAGDNEMLKESIRAQSEKKQKQLRLREARAAKSESLFNIGIRTAENIVKVFPNVALIALAAATGAAQAAFVAAKPLPKFHTGKESGKGNADSRGEINSIILKDEKVLPPKTSKELLNNGWTNKMLDSLAFSGVSPRQMFTQVVGFDSSKFRNDSELAQIRQRQERIEQNIESLSKGQKIYVGAAQDGGYKVYTEKAMRRQQKYAERRQM